MPDARPALRRELGLSDLVLFNIAAVVSLRWLATAAHIGPGSLALWAGAALFFFLPLARAVAHLAEWLPEEGGIYVWTRHSFGEWHGFICAWCYWLSNLFYFPNLLVSGVGIALYNAGGSDRRALVVLTSVMILWLAVVTNVAGLSVGKWLQNVGAPATFAAGAGLIVLGLLVLARDGAPARLFAGPDWSWSSLNFWPQIAFAFGGLELGAILAGEVRDPRRTIRRAAWISGGAIAAFYVLGTLAILTVLRPAEVNIVTGLGQAADVAAGRLGVPWAVPPVAALIMAGFAGQFGAWMGGGARLAFVIGLERYLPAAFSRLHPRWGTPHVALYTQGAACAFFLLAMQAGENLRTGYQLLVDMTVITYFIPFLYLFATAWKRGRRWIGLSGLAVTAAGVAFSFVPPDGVRSVWLFETKLVASCAVLILAGRAFFVRGRSLARG
jgi:amino acid transporter